MTGDGVVRRATAQENPALFWALRGGKGALGIVTAVEFDLMPFAEIYAGALYFDGSQAAAVLHAWRRWAQTLPDEATTSIAVLRLPELPTVPPPLAGRVTVAVRFAWVGDPAAGQATLASLRRRRAGPARWGRHDAVCGAGLHPRRPGRSDARPRACRAAHRTDRRGRRRPAGDGGPRRGLPADHRGTAAARRRHHPPAGHPSAVSHRDLAFTLLTIGLAIPPLTDAVTTHGNRLLATMSRWSNGGCLPNFAAADDPAAVARNYDPATLDRLGSLARTYDPQSVIAAAAALRSVTG